MPVQSASSSLAVTVVARPPAWTTADPTSTPELTQGASRPAPATTTARAARTSSPRNTLGRITAAATATVLAKEVAVRARASATAATAKATDAAMRAAVTAARRAAVAAGHVGAYTRCQAADSGMQPPPPGRRPFRPLRGRHDHGRGWPGPFLGHRNSSDCSNAGRRRRAPRHDRQRRRSDGRDRRPQPVFSGWGALAASRSGWRCPHTARPAGAGSPLLSARIGLSSRRLAARGPAGGRMPAADSDAG